MQPPESITQLLVDWNHGDQKALDKLMPMVYSELRRLAGNYLRRERPGTVTSISASRGARSSDSKSGRMRW